MGNRQQCSQHVAHDHERVPCVPEQHPASRSAPGAFGTVDHSIGHSTRIAASEPNSKGAVRQQFGVLPYRETKKAGLEILLVTSRETHRWVIPKGWPIKGLKPPASAAREAYEEAGVSGTIRTRSLGSYLYEKRFVEKHTTAPCEVTLYPLQVTRQETTWPEQTERKRFWFSPVTAIAAVSENGLKEIIGDFVNGRQKIVSSGSKAKAKRRRLKRGSIT